MPISQERRKQRRARLLAKTREFVRAQGIQAVNIRKLAQYCDVSVPTLYNQFGNKDGLLQAAGEEVFLNHYSSLDHPENCSALERMLYLDGKNVDMILENAELSILLTKAGRVDASSLRMARGVFGELIEDIKRQGDLVDWVDTRYIAERIYVRIRAVVAEWAFGAINDEQLRRIRHLDIALVLLGVTTGETHAFLKQMLIEDRSRREKNHFEKAGWTGKPSLCGGR
jgi:AcrR family transcriptional regulator